MKEVHAYPSKSFFVGMLTRDIELSDAILDLLDNCLDGILRQEVDLKKEKPYEGFHAELTITENEFIIKDNCGGIPKNIAKEHAFRMGRKPTRGDDDLPTIGMYGIGMKRAMFKMGKDIHVVSQHGSDTYNVHIDSTWLANDDDWVLDLNDQENIGYDGTIITVKDLHLGIKRTFNKESFFVSEMIDMISTHYAYIIKKGLKIIINGQSIEPKTLSLLFSNDYKPKEGILPYVYKENYDGLEVTIIVGIQGQTPSLEEDKEDAEAKVHKKSDAGWTIICNDRIVLYGDKSRITGWGDRGIPEFHYQFNTIVGIVEFKSKNSEKLPVTTTKKGLDTSSDVYLRIKNKMLDGLRKYITYTNRWKNSKELERQTVITKTKSLAIDKIESIVKLVGGTVDFGETRDDYKGQFSKIELIEPPKAKKDSETIKFSRKIKDIETVSSYLTSGEGSGMSSNEVGVTCFEIILEKAQKV